MLVRWVDRAVSAFLIVVFAAVLTAIVGLGLWAFAAGQFVWLLVVCGLAVVFRWVIAFTWPELGE
jgi:hypothetical protein